MSISEFGLIDRFFKRPTDDDKDIVLGIGDDAALLRTSDHSPLLVKSNTLVEGVDFEPGQNPSLLGCLLLEELIAQLAKQNARPAWATLSLTLPGSRYEISKDINGPDEDWLETFSNGLFEMASKYDLRIVGGDTTQGPTTMITIHVYGVNH